MRVRRHFALALSSLLTFACGSESLEEDELARTEDELVMDTSPTYTIQGVASGKCLQIVGGSTANVAAVEIRTCNGSAAQQFRLEHVTGERYAIRNVQSNKCLDVLNFSTADAAPIIQYDCHRDVNQQWVFASSNGALRVTSQLSGKVLDVNGASSADGARLIQYRWLNANNQRFRVVGAGGGPTPPPPNPPPPNPPPSTCDLAPYDSARPPQALALTGSLGTHDPVIIQAHGQYYLFATGNGLGAKTSTNLLDWRNAPAVFGSNPAWIAQQVPGATNLWAPDISHFGGQYHLYYSASTFGSNRSCIGHATRTALNSGNWTDRGPVICSNTGSERHNWNAIDPNIVLDEAGTPWMSFGSFWGGLKLIQLDQAGNRANNTVHSIAARPNANGAVEAPFIVRRCGHYYLFASIDSCCQGSNSTYKVVVGRSTSITGPYTDRQGVPMMQGGGTLVLQGNSRWRGPGHNAVLIRDRSAFNVYHSYDANNNGNPILRISELAWDNAGWPISGGP